MSAFRIGQRVVCINKDGWVKYTPNDKDPVYNEVCEIEGYNSDGGFFLKGFGYGYDENGERYIWGYHSKWFRPLEEYSASVSIEVLQSLPVTIKETIDAPIPEYHD